VKKGLFLRLSKLYLLSAKNSFYYVGQISLLLRPALFVVAIFYAIVLSFISLIFSVLTILDLITFATDSIRKTIINFMDNQCLSIDNSFISFIFSPIVLVLVAPIFIASLFLPRPSSNDLLDIAENKILDAVSGHGVFKRINEIIWSAAHNLFDYVPKVCLFLKPIVAIVAIVYSIILIIIGTIFFIFVPLDWLNNFFKRVMHALVNFAYVQHDKIMHNTGAFLFSPIILILLFPILLTIVFIPKFTAYFEMDA